VRGRNPRAGVVLLAAGRARRFGRDKRLQRLPGGATVLAATLDAVCRAGLPCRLCVHPRDAALAARLRRPGVRVHLCRAADRGMGASLAAALRPRPCWDAVIIALADMPSVRPATYRHLAAAAAPASIVAPYCAGRRGNPVAFGRRFYRDLARCRGDSGARAVVAAAGSALQRLVVDDPAILRDIDRPRDLLRERRA
jgi:molybdenum cofactor cytidylyltransferase